MKLSAARRQQVGVMTEPWYVPSRQKTPGKRCVRYRSGLSMGNRSYQMTLPPIDKVLLQPGKLIGLCHHQLYFVNSTHSLGDASGVDTSNSYVVAYAIETKLSSSRQQRSYEPAYPGTKAVRRPHECRAAVPRAMVLIRRWSETGSGISAFWAPRATA
jgi:hypothetical protein